MSREQSTPGAHRMERIPVLEERVHLVTVGDEAILYDESTGSYRHLNTSATAACLLIDGRTSLQAITDSLAGVYQAPVPTVRDDVLRLTAELVDRDLLRWTDAVPGRP